jgi:hypothetical protein
VTVALARRTVWVLGKKVGMDQHGEPIYEFFTGAQGRSRGPSRSPFRADGYKFHSARSAYECADTHEEIRNSSSWVVLRVTDNTLAVEPRSQGAQL